MSEPLESIEKTELPHGHQEARGVQTTWVYTLASMVFFFVMLDAVVLLTLLTNFQQSESLADAALVVATLASSAMQVRFCWFLRVGRGGGLPHIGWTVALFLPAVVAWVLGFLSEDAALIAALPLWMAINVAAPLMTRVWCWGLLLVGVLVTLAHPMLVARSSGDSPDVPDVNQAWVMFVYSALLPAMVLSCLWWWGVVVKLDHHRSLAAELAVTEERLRFASDLHDIQGHHLQVIALKSELAERTLAVDPDAAREHIREVRLIAKQALEETRSLVAGYRDVALDEELENAREVLAAAGAQCDLGIGRLPADAETRRVLALVVREATTNILRHSEASQVSIRLETTDAGTSLEVNNNAVSSATPSGRTASSGLDGLRDRVVALGGQLDVQADAVIDRFDLLVFIPTRGGTRA